MSAEGVRAAWDKYRFAVLVIALGAGLMLWPTGRRDAAASEPPSQTRDLQDELQRTLGKIRNVGAVWVLLTEESGPSRTLARDTTASFRGEEYSERSETVLLDGATAVVVTRTDSATYRGALVVCEGGDLPAVKLAVTEAVTALTGLPANRVAVVKCQ